ncbi:hypothetical protein FK531_22005 [Rhodococcus spelaei]|uniref:Tetratricopeptide repeat protein n=1 Tax=Rhodococcus spelaei TaxID=2546320 RepID=A0A541AZ01_9NOCA|nr:hypothetical protein [Rhodococcus spelaei]TQF65296.1 hypothetical protein FK531_22005 [Rhodococcus spelaei]
MSESSNGAAADMSELVERSSLGTRGARQLRARVPAEHAELVRKISELLELADGGSITALLDLADLYRKVDNDSKAEECYRQVASYSLTKVSEIHEGLGDVAGAKQWKARADTL